MVFDGFKIWWFTYLHLVDVDFGGVGAVEQDADVGQGSNDHPRLHRHEDPEAEGNKERDQVDFWKFD